MTLPIDCSAKQGGAKHITGDIITAEMYKQQDLFDKYEEPTIANKFDDE